MRFRSGLRLTAVLGIAALLPLATGGAAVAAHAPGRVFKGTKSALTAAQAERLAAHATHRSIIIFKNQLTPLPSEARCRIASGTTAWTAGLAFSLLISAEETVAEIALMMW